MRLYVNSVILLIVWFFHSFGKIRSKIDLIVVAMHRVMRAWNSLIIPSKLHYHICIYIYKVFNCIVASIIIFSKSLVWTKKTHENLAKIYLNTPNYQIIHKTSSRAITYRIFFRSARQYKWSLWVSIMAVFCVHTKCVCFWCLYICYVIARSLNYIFEIFCFFFLFFLFF